MRHEHNAILNHINALAHLLVFDFINAFFDEKERSDKNIRRKVLSPHTWRVKGEKIFYVDSIHRKI